MSANVNSEILSVWSILMATAHNASHFISPIKDIAWLIWLAARSKYLIATAVNVIKVFLKIKKQESAKMVPKD